MPKIEKGDTLSLEVELLRIGAIELCRSRCSVMLV